MEDHPHKPTMLWDGDCGFCFRWIRRWQKITGDAVEYYPYREKLSELPQVSEADCKVAVQLVLPDGRVLSAAHAVLQSLSIAGRAKRLLALYERSRFFRGWAEGVYRFVAVNRFWLSKLS